METVHCVEPCTQTETIVESTLPVLRLRLERPRNQRRVMWGEGTVDNEHMGKKKSKCCCIYRKPVAFGESSSEDDEECENCFGHPEKRRRNRKDTQHKPEDNFSNETEPVQPQNSADVVLKNDNKADGCEEQNDKHSHSSE